MKIGPKPKPQNLFFKQPRLLVEKYILLDRVQTENQDATVYLICPTCSTSLHVVG